MNVFSERLQELGYEPSASARALFMKENRKKLRR